MNTLSEALACIQAYKRLRMEGEHDMVSILLGVNTQLMQFDFRETFVDSFAVELYDCHMTKVIMCSENDS